MTGQGLSGLIAFIGLACLLSEDRPSLRRRFPWRVVAGALALQAVLALVLLNWPPAKAAFLLINDAVLALQAATGAGTAVVFG
ncbi:MAG: Na+ dependent nucleoside transporter N-terminal domain-containing protein [Rhodospirillaceae bacterium]